MLSHLLTAALLLSSLVSPLGAQLSGVAPRIEQHPHSIVVNLTDPVTLECRATGHPKPEITWHKDGKPLNVAKSSDADDAAKSSSSGKYALIHDSSLFIFAATLGRGNKSDAGVYHCQAANVHGVARSENATLAIAFLKEDFRETPKSRQVNAGTVVSMECKAPRGFPEPVVWWEKDGAALKARDSVELALSNGSLSIRNASVVDNGEYVCVAKNEAGFRRSAPARLNVFGEFVFLEVLPLSS